MTTPQLEQAPNVCQVDPFPCAPSEAQQLVELARLETKNERYKADPRTDTAFIVRLESERNERNERLGRIESRRNDHIERLERNEALRLERNEALPGDEPE